LCGQIQITIPDLNRDLNVWLFDLSPVSVSGGSRKNIGGRLAPHHLGGNHG